nr:hypothetical protein GCM10020063_048190 [Dactylosporangium thailandense]
MGDGTVYDRGMQSVRGVVAASAVGGVAGIAVALYLAPRAEMPPAVVVGLGLVFGVLFGFVVAVLVEQRVYGSRPFTDEERSAAHLAIRRAEPPADPKLRAVADEVARRQAGRDGLQVAAVVLPAVFVVHAAVSVALGHPSGWMRGAFWLLLGSAMLALRARLRGQARRYLAAAEGR